MNLLKARVGTVVIAASECAVCERPCDHEDLETGIGYPGAYDAASDTDDTRPYHPICDPCVLRHYPELVAELQAARRHFYAEDPDQMPKRLRREFGIDPPSAYPPIDTPGL